MSAIFDGLFDSAASLAALAVLIAAAFGLGRPLVRGLGIDDEDPLSLGVWSVSLGLICGGTLLAAVGMLGGLYESGIGAVTAALAMAGIGQMISVRTRWTARRRDLPADDAWWRAPAPPQPPDGVRLVVLTFAVTAALAALVTAMSPPTAGDALCYHLELPRRFLQRHALVFLPDNDNSTYPLLVEMWYLWALALDGPVAAQLVHWGLGVLTALATVLVASPLVGRPWAGLAGAMMLLVPGINNQMGAPLNDVGLTLFTTLAVAAWWRAVSGENRPRWYLVLGLVLGAAWAIKYLALVFTGAMGFATTTVAWHRRETWRPLLHGAAAALVVATSVAGVWYVRAAWYRGNPVYPFFGEVVSDGAADATPTVRNNKLPLGRTPWSLAAAPWQMTMSPEQFGGSGHQLGAVFLATVPVLLVVRRLRGLRTLLAIAACHAAGVLLLRQNVRFLFPIAPLLSAAVVWVGAEIQRFRRVPRAVAGGVLFALLAVGAAYPCYRARNHVAVALGFETRADYLRRKEPTYQAAEFANQWLPREAHLLSQEHRAFYFDARVTRENLYRRRTHYDQAPLGAESWSRRLRGAGFTHLLLAEALDEHGVQYEPTLSRLADAELLASPNPGIVCVKDYTFDNSDGRRRYRLMVLR